MKPKSLSELSMISAELSAAMDLLNNATAVLRNMHTSVMSALASMPVQPQPGRSNGGVCYQPTPNMGHIYPFPIISASEAGLITMNIENVIQVLNNIREGNTFPDEHPERFEKGRESRDNGFPHWDVGARYSFPPRPGVKTSPDYRENPELHPINNWYKSPAQRKKDLYEGNFDKDRPYDYKVKNFHEITTTDNTDDFMVLVEELGVVYYYRRFKKIYTGIIDRDVSTVRKQLLSVRASILRGRDFIAPIITSAEDDAKVESSSRSEVTTKWVGTGNPFDLVAEKVSDIDVSTTNGSFMVLITSLDQVFLFSKAKLIYMPVANAVVHSVYKELLTEREENGHRTGFGFKMPTIVGSEPRQVGLALVRSETTKMTKAQFEASLKMFPLVSLEDVDANLASVSPKEFYIASPSTAEPKEYFFYLGMVKKAILVEFVDEAEKPTSFGVRFTHTPGATGERDEKGIENTSSENTALAEEPSKKLIYCDTPSVKMTAEHLCDAKNNGVPFYTTAYFEEMFKLMVDLMDDGWGSSPSGICIQPCYIMKEGETDEVPVPYLYNPETMTATRVEIIKPDIIEPVKPEEESVVKKSPVKEKKPRVRK